MKDTCIARGFSGWVVLALMGLSGLASAQQTVTITAPANNSTSPVSTAINLAASTTGTVNRVRFKQNGVRIGTGDTTAPYTATYTPLTAGTYVFVAEALYSNSVVATSSAVTVTVGSGGGNTAPTVSLTAPTSGASQAAPASFSLTASASDSDGTIQNVKFYADGVLLNTDAGSPFTGTYATSATGTHALTAVATDDDGATTTSAAVSVSVTGGSGGGSVSVTRRYVYDEYQRLCKTIDPEAGATVIDYDAAGNIAWVAEGTNLTSNTCDRGSVTAGQKTVRTYNSMNRVTAVSTPGGTADLTTTYHADGRLNTLTAANPGGYNVVTTYSYNKRRLLTAETSTNGSTLYSLGYGYSANGHLSTLAYPDTLLVSYAPDALGRATQVVGAIGGINTTYASGIGYYPNGAISGFTYGNGIVHTMTQNTRRLPSRSQDKNGTTAILDDSYAFDGNGNVTDITDQAQAGLTTRGMAYDGLDRLTAAVSPSQWGNATYTYDALDNLRSADQGTRQYRYNYDPTSNRLSTIKDPAGATLFTFGYDAQGNTVAKNSQALVFDSANRLSEVTGQQVYRYDGQGRRVQTTDADTKATYWIYSQSGQVMYTTEARRSQNLSYIYLGNTQIATRAMPFLGSGGTLAVRYQHTDALGSPVAETDEQRTVVKRNSYAPYGETFAPTAIDGAGYTGHVMDQATGLTYMQQRYYDPQLGRFLSIDPMTVDTSNAFNFGRYSYGNNSPLSFKDPDGRMADFLGAVKDFLKNPREAASHLVASLGLNMNSDNANDRAAAQAVAAPMERQIARTRDQAAGLEVGAQDAAKVADRIGWKADGVAIATVRVPLIAVPAAIVGRAAGATGLVLHATPQRALEAAVGPLARGTRNIVDSEAAGNAVEGSKVVYGALEEAGERLRAEQ